MADMTCPECWSPLHKISHKLARNEIIDDLPMVKSGDDNIRTTIRTGLPAVTWRKINYSLEKNFSDLMFEFDCLYEFEYPTIKKQLSLWFDRVAVIEVAIVALAIAAFSIYEILNY